jgi:hypothetical protein
LVNFASERELEQPSPASGRWDEYTLTLALSHKWERELEQPSPSGRWDLN